jgi:MYXO-CTERM domain-containing protein
LRRHVAHRNGHCIGLVVEGTFMSRIKIFCVAVVLSALAFGLWPRAAHAFSVRIHIHLANAIRDDMMKNLEATGKPKIRLLGPKGAPEKFVELLLEDAEAIRDFPEFWRAGAIGPDNTVFTGLTDPSHAWMFEPFVQCQTLLDASSIPEERAYALGCFLHGISDNAAHHVVNFFTGETFTLYPADAAQDGQLEFSLINVVRHITVEGKFEESVQKVLPGEFAPEKLKHRIPIDLVRRVYYEDDQGNHGLWRSFAGHLVTKKNQALRSATVPGFDPEKHLSMSVDELRANKVTLDFDGSILSAYIQFLSSGGEVVGVSPGEMTPADYVLFMPEILSDVKRLLTIAVLNGEKKLADTLAEWKAAGSCSVTCPVLRLKKELYEHLYDPGANGGTSRMQQAVNRKFGELDAIMDAYLVTIERLSNANVTKGIANLNPIDVATILQPLVTAVSNVADFPYDLLFPPLFTLVLDQISGLKQFLQETFILVGKVIMDQIVARVRTFLGELNAQIAALRAQVLGEIAVRIQELRDKLKDTLDAAKLAAIGLDLDDSADLFATFNTSVLYMNTYNSIVGVLGNQLVAAPQEVVPGFFSGPVSFDASYQLTYNQLALCNDLAKVFYPCGHTATEMLQPDFARCQKLDASVVPDSNIECHRADPSKFLADPDIDACKATLLDELIAPTGGHIGSYTLAYPARLADPPPMCINPPLVGINADGFGDKADCQGGGNCEREDGAFGCGCSSTNAGAIAWPLVFVALGMMLILRRRRRR